MIMNSLHLLSRLPTKCLGQPVMLRGLSNSAVLSKKKDICRQNCDSGKKRKGSKHGDSMKCDRKRRDSDDGDLPEPCSKATVMECARKLKELEREWMSIASRVTILKEAQRKRSQDEEPKGNRSLLLYVGVGTVVAAIAYWLYSLTQQIEGNDGKYDTEEAPQEEEKP